MPDIRLFVPSTSADWASARAIVTEYAASLAVDLCFQDFEAELTALPVVYGPPCGAFLLVTVDGRLAGCGALRPCDVAAHPGACELKRLYVRPAFRALGLGRRLAGALIERASALGYAAMLLDTLADMRRARELYASLGFVPVAPYYDNPLAGTHYLKLALA